MPSRETEERNIQVMSEYRARTLITEAHERGFKFVVLPNDIKNTLLIADVQFFTEEVSGNERCYAIYAPLVMNYFVAYLKDMRGHAQISLDKDGKVGYGEWDKSIRLE